MTKTEYMESNINRIENSKGDPIKIGTDLVSHYNKLDTWAHGRTS